MTGNFDGIKTRHFGVEIEMTDITRCEAAKAIQKVLEKSGVSSKASSTKCTPTSQRNFRR